MPKLNTHRHIHALLSLRGPKGRSNLPGIARYSKDCFVAALLAMTCLARHCEARQRRGNLPVNGAIPALITRAPNIPRAKDKETRRAD